MSKLTGIMCPVCDQAGITNSEMIIVSGNFAGGDGSRMYKCSVQNHQLEHNRLMSLQPRMRKLHVQEKMPAGAVAQPVWVYPQVWQRLLEKYPSNLQTTLCSLLTSLASDATILIEGDIAVEMKQAAAQAGLPLARGRDLMALVKSHIELLKQMETFRIQQEALAPIMNKLLGVGAGAGDSGFGQGMQGTQQQQPGQQQIPPRSQQLAPIEHNEFGESVDASGNYVESADMLQGPPRQSMSATASTTRPAGLPVPTPQQQR